MRMDFARNFRKILLVIVVILCSLFLTVNADMLPNMTKLNLDLAVWSKYPNPEKLELAKKTKKNPSQGIIGFLDKSSDSVVTHIPKYKIAWAHPTNYGERFTKDIQGRAVKNNPIIVLHETYYSAASAINFFKNANLDEKVQASYHTLIELDGTIVYIVPPEKRAFGAANSVFNGTNGAETVQTNPKIAPSVNNFAYHVALETPPDGRGNQKSTHNGYTNAQYNSLAWLIAQTKVQDSRITTHKAVDIAAGKIDPRSFNLNKFLILLHSNQQGN
jgi:N-acetylmuramoyl-L-alanine amidase